MTGSLNWLGHNDLCSIQWSDYCDCNSDASHVDGCMCHECTYCDRCEHNPCRCKEVAG